MKEQVTDIIYLCWCFVLSCRKQLLANETANLTFIGLDKKKWKEKEKSKKENLGKTKKKSERSNEPILRMSCYRGMEGWNVVIFKGWKYKSLYSIQGIS